MPLNDDEAQRQKSLKLNYTPAQRAMILSGACSPTGKAPTTPCAKAATAEGRRMAMSLGLVTDGMFAQKLNWPLATFFGAVGRAIPLPDACDSPRAWTVATANSFLEFMGKEGRFGPGSITLGEKVDGLTFARLVGKAPKEFAALCDNGRPNQLPSTIKFTDGTYAWTRRDVVGYLLTIEPNR